jgi:hypothetical protein
MMWSDLSQPQAVLVAAAVGATGAIIGGAVASVVGLQTTLAVAAVGAALEAQLRQEGGGVQGGQCRGKIGGSNRAGAGVSAKM